MCPLRQKDKKMYIESCFIVFSFFDMSLAYHEYKFIRKTQRSAVQISCTETIKRLLLTLLRFHFCLNYACEQQGRNILSLSLYQFE